MLRSWTWGILILIVVCVIISHSQNSDQTQTKTTTTPLHFISSIMLILTLMISENHHCHHHCHLVHDKYHDSHFPPDSPKAQLPPCLLPREAFIGILPMSTLSGFPPGGIVIIAITIDITIVFILIGIIFPCSLDCIIVIIFHLH